MLLAYHPHHQKEDIENQQLWSALRKGRQQALSDLFVLHHHHLFNYGIKINADRELVRGCIQKLFMDLWERHSHLGEAVSPKAYLLASLRRSILEETNKNRARAIRGQKFLDRNLQDAFTVEELLIREEVTQERRETLQHALNDLSPRQKEVIFLRFYHGLSNSEITDIMNINNQCVRNLLSDALRRLRQRTANLIRSE